MRSWIDEGVLMEDQVKRALSEIIDPETGLEYHENGPYPRFKSDRGW